MRNIVLISTFFIFFISGFSSLNYSSCVNCASAEMLDVDYNFIDNAFNGIKPVSDKKFNDTINRLTPQPVDNSFMGKIRAFLFGRKYGVDPNQTQNNDIKEKEVDFGGEKQAIEEMKQGVQFVKLLVSIYSDDKKIIRAGNYKIKEVTDDGIKYLAFFQGNSEYGKLKLKKYPDDPNSDQVVYSKIDIIDDNTVRIIYSTLSETNCAIGRVFEEK